MRQCSDESERKLICLTQFHACPVVLRFQFWSIHLGRWGFKDLPAQADTRDQPARPDQSGHRVRKV